MTSSTTVHESSEEDRARGVSTIVAAFVTDPIVRWFYSEPHAYLAYMPAIVEAFGGRAFDHGSAYHTDGFGGVGLWLPPGVSPDSETMGALMEASLPEADKPMFFAFFEAQGKFHPHEPHWYLPLIGVDPAKQGSGHGSALLAHSLEACDRDHVPAYLESTNPRNNPLYERYGFEAIGLIQTAESPPMWPMLRKPR